MSSPFRATPPQTSSRPLLERTRLIEILDGRFERRLTVLCAGAGFGKTTLLMQATQQNAEDPVGLDRWLTCSAADDQARRLGEGLCQAVGVSNGGVDPVGAVCDAIWRESPLDVALIVDDIHTIGAEGGGAELLERLLEELPANGHLVLASRTELPFRWAKLAAAGEACLIDEAELAFDSDERAAFLGLRGASAEDGNWASWPALLELAVAYDRNQVHSFLWEEILSDLSDSVRRDLARLSSLDWVDRGRLAAFTQQPEEIYEIASKLPLTIRGENGELRIHDLWRTALGQVDPAWSRDELRSAVAYLIDGRCFPEAVGLCRAAKADKSELQSVTKSIALLHWQRFTPAELELLIRELPADALAAAEGRALQGYHRLHVDPDRARPFLESARVEFEQRGESELECGVLSALGHLAWFRTDPEEIARWAERLGAIGSARAQAGRHLSEASRHLVLGEPKEAITSIDRARRSADQGLEGIDTSHAAISYLDAGEPERAIAEIDAGIGAASPQMQRTLLAARIDAEWALGRMDRKRVAAIDDRLLTAPIHTHNRVLMFSVVAFQNASLGRLAKAQTYLDRARQDASASLGARSAMALAVATMATEIEAGNEEAARIAIESCLEAQRDVSLNYRHALRGATLAALVSDAARERFDALQPGGCYALGMQIASSLLHYRETGDPSGAMALPWDALPRMRTFLVPRVLLELCLIGAAAGSNRAAALGEQLASGHRDVLRHISAREGSPAAKLASEWIRRVPARPVEGVRVDVLGPLRVVRGGVELSDPILRRERVRALLHRLLARRSWRRSELAAELWPQLDERAAANNLRVNLTHLVRLLEPDKIAGEPSFLVIQDAERVELRDDEALSIDADVFSSTLDAAERADRAGQPERALELLEHALDLYRGDYIEDAVELPRIEPDRVRLQSLMSRAAVRAAALRMGRGQYDRAHAWIRKVLDVDDLSEPAHRMQALIFLRQEDRSAARATLEHALKRLAAAGIDAEPETLRLAQRLGIPAASERAQPS